MSLKEFNTVFTNLGDLSYSFLGTENSQEILGKLWEYSTSFCVVSGGEVVTTEDFYAGEKRRKKANEWREIFSGFPILKEIGKEFVFARSWAFSGVTNKDCIGILVFGATKSIKFDFFSPNCRSVFWKDPFNAGWDDLMLFKDQHIIFYAITHEKYGAVYGDERLFKYIGLRGESFKPVSGNKKEFCLSGNYISEPLLVEFFKDPEKKRKRKMSSRKI